MQVEDQGRATCKHLIQVRTTKHTQSASEEIHTSAIRNNTKCILVPVEHTVQQLWTHSHTLSQCIQTPNQRVFVWNPVSSQSFPAYSKSHTWSQSKWNCLCEQSDADNKGQIPQVSFLLADAAGLKAGFLFKKWRETLVIRLYTHQRKVYLCGKTTFQQCSCNVSDRTVRYKFHCSFKT